MVGESGFILWINSLVDGRVLQLYNSNEDCGAKLCESTPAN